MHVPTIALDFDGVLNDFDGHWSGPYDTGDPAPGVREFLADLASTHRLVIYSLRAPVVVVDWLKRHDLMQYIDGIAEHKPSAEIYIDDKAVCHRGDFNQTLAAVRAFRPHWRA